MSTFIYMTKWLYRRSFKWPLRRSYDKKGPSTCCAPRLILMMVKLSPWGDVKLGLLCLLLVVDFCFSRDEKRQMWLPLALTWIFLTWVCVCVCFASVWIQSISDFCVGLWTDVLHVSHYNIFLLAVECYWQHNSLHLWVYNMQMFKIISCHNRHLGLVNIIYSLLSLRYAMLDSLSGPFFMCNLLQNQ